MKRLGYFLLTLDGTWCRCLLLEVFADAEKVHYFLEFGRFQEMRAYLDLYRAQASLSLIYHDLNLIKLYDWLNLIKSQVILYSIQLLIQGLLNYDFYDFHHAFNLFDFS